MMIALIQHTDYFDTNVKLAKPDLLYFVIICRYFNVLELDIAM